MHLKFKHPLAILTNLYNVEFKTKAYLVALFGCTIKIQRSLLAISSFAFSTLLFNFFLYFLVILGLYIRIQRLFWPYLFIQTFFLAIQPMLMFIETFNVFKESQNGISFEFVLHILWTLVPEFIFLLLDCFFYSIIHKTFIVEFVEPKG